MWMIHTKAGNHLKQLKHVEAVSGWSMNQTKLPTSNDADDAPVHLLSHVYAHNAHATSPMLQLNTSGCERNLRFFDLTHCAFWGSLHSWRHAFRCTLGKAAKPLRNRSTTRCRTLLPFMFHAFTQPTCSAPPRRRHGGRRDVRREGGLQGRAPVEMPRNAL